MPWDSWLDQISANLSGPTARRVIIIAIVSCGFGFCFSEGGHLFRKLIYLAAGVTIIATAASFIMPFLGFAEAGIGTRPTIPPMSLALWAGTLGGIAGLGVLLGLHMDREERRRDA